MNEAVISRRAGLLFLAGAGFALAGCSQVKRLTGQNDDTVLPGEREAILPPSQTTGQSPDITRRGSAAGGGIDQGMQDGGTAPGDLAACDPETDAGCNMTGSNSSSGGGSGDIFSDGQ